MILHNFGSDEFKVNIGDRIAQLILERFESRPVTLIDGIASTIRGDEGFGSAETNSVTDEIHDNWLQACYLTMSITVPWDIIDINVNTNHTHPTL